MLRLLVIAVGVAVACSVAIAQRPSAGTDEFQFVLRGMRTERFKLKSGACRITGRYTVLDTKTGEPVLDGPLEIFAAFDGAKRRFDCSIPGWEGDPASVRPHPSGEKGRVISEMMKGTVITKFSDNGNKACYWAIKSGNQIEIRAAVGNRRMPVHAEFFDVRGLGIYHKLALSAQRSLVTMFDDYASMPTKTRIERDETGQWSVHWINDDKYSLGATDTVLHVSVREGFTPVRFTMREKHVGKPEAQWHTTQDYHTTWSTKEGVWLPIKHHYVVTPFNGSSRLNVDMSITWEIVNQPIDEDVFHWKGFGAPEDVPVIDVSLGAPIVIRERGTSPPPRRLGWHWILGGFVVLAFVALVIRRGRSRAISA